MHPTIIIINNSNIKASIGLNGGFLSDFGSKILLGGTSEIYIQEFIMTPYQAICDVIENMILSYL